MTHVQFTNVHKNGKHTYSNAFDSLFNTDPFFSRNTVSVVPEVNIAEGENEFYIELAVPGLKKEDFKINLNKNYLLVSADHTPESTEQRKYNKREFNYESFSRTFILPDTADQSNIHAEYTNGILLIHIAKREDSNKQSREISII
jgi:HSP20 family protein